MSPFPDCGAVMVTGASGQIGREVCRLLRDTGKRFIPVDVDTMAGQDITQCDLTVRDSVARLFQNNSVQAVVHLAAILPSAFDADPLAAVGVNLNASFELIRQAVDARVRRFVFASSMSVYGSDFDPRARNEQDPATPDNPYAASKRVVEVVGDRLARMGAMEFVSLRIARVIGSGTKKTASPWRSQMFESLSGYDAIQIPFAPDSLLSLVHAEDVARMLITLSDVPNVHGRTYNTPAETWKVGELKTLIEQVQCIRVDLGRDGSHAGPLCDGSRFASEFAFELRGLRERLLNGRTPDRQTPRLH
jgi:nucleoside-diphosphate-sugar epimerase